LVAILSALLDANATGWNELINTHNPVFASYTMFNTAWGGWFVVMIFVIFQFMLYMKTKSLLLGWIMNMLFIAMWLSTPYVKSTSVSFIFLLAVLQLGTILYILFWRRE
jgi:hypothetical protein